VWSQKHQPPLVATCPAVRPSVAVDCNAKAAGIEERPGVVGLGRASAAVGEGTGRASFEISIVWWSVPSPSRGVRREGDEAALTTVPLTGFDRAEEGGE